MVAMFSRWGCVIIAGKLERRRRGASNAELSLVSFTSSMRVLATSNRRTGAENSVAWLAQPHPLYVSDGSSVQMEIAHPADAAALAAQCLPNQLRR
eukprot:COSAG02_NODE_2_length_75708_cov_87.013953_38_plen_96_part_00